eukprot:1172844-Prorocentrum_minimum.AAC.1
MIGNGVGGCLREGSGIMGMLLGSAGGAHTTITGQRIPSGDRLMSRIHRAELNTGKRNTAEVLSGSALHSVMKCRRIDSMEVVSDV